MSRRIRSHSIPLLIQQKSGQERPLERAYSKNKYRFRLRLNQPVNWAREAANISTIAQLGRRETQAQCCIRGCRGNGRRRTTMESRPKGAGKNVGPSRDTRGTRPEKDAPGAFPLAR